MITKAAVARGVGASLAVETLTLREPGPGEVLVRLVASGVSRFDLSMRDDPGAPFPLVSGFEGAGLVEGAGSDVASFAAGDAVVLLGPAQMGDRRAHPFTDGDLVGVGLASFATHCLCPAEALARVPVAAPLELLAGFGGEVRAAVAAVLDHAVGDGTVVVAGAGAAGLAALMAARACGASVVVVVDPDASRRTLASELGASLVAHTDDDLAAVVASLTGAGAHLTIDATGHAATIAACLRATRPDGTCGSLRLAAADGAADARMLDFAHRGSAETVVAVAAWHARGNFPIERLISFFPFEHVNDALAALAADTVIKPVIRFSLGPFVAQDRAGTEGAAAEAPEDGDAERGATESTPPSAPVLG